MALRTTPNWKRRSPIAAARERPVDIVIEPITETSSLDRFRMPICLLILAEQAFFYLRGTDVPGWLRVIDQRSVAAPAMWI